MTLCIAIACTHEEEDRIVLCTDWKEEIEGIGSAEITDKLVWVADGWPALTSGINNQIEDLVRLYRQHLTKTNLNEDNYVDELREPAKQYKGVLAENFIQQLLGVSYNYFLKFGKRRFPDDFFRERVSEIARIKLQAQLIIAGFLKGSALGDVTEGLFPVICVVEDSESHLDAVREEVHFASIGSGSFIANAALYNRGANNDMSVLGAIYAAFEAHRASETVPGVGESMSIYVLEPSKPAPSKLRSLSDAGYDYCEFLWKKFGPKEVQARHKDLFKMKDDFLDED